MSRLVKNLRNNRSVVFDKGKFDDWCVFIVEFNGMSAPPRDIEYFTELKQIAAHYPEHKLYNDFVQIYNLTSQAIAKEAVELIDNLTLTYQPQHQLKMEQWFTVLYAGMVAEENKEKAVLKKRIKRLGMHQVLVLNHAPESAANFSKGKKWRELDDIMRELGF
jgi:membrane carboxypeptidase/penicillin-binding protein